MSHVSRGRHSIREQYRLDHVCKSFNLGEKRGCDSKKTKRKNCAAQERSRFRIFQSSIKKCLKRLESQEIILTSMAALSFSRAGLSDIDYGDQSC